MPSSGSCGIDPTTSDSANPGARLGCGAAVVIHSGIAGHGGGAELRGPAGGGVRGRAGGTPDLTRPERAETGSPLGAVGAEGGPYGHVEKGSGLG